MIGKKYAIITIAIVMIAAPVLAATVYAEHSKGKAKEWCPDYGGKWKNGKCQIKDSEDIADYEDDICDNKYNVKKYPKICNS
jgi:hypothetical protein